MRNRATVRLQSPYSRSCVELSKMWRLDKYLRRLDVRATPLLPALPPLLHQGCAWQQLHSTGWGCSCSPCTSFCTARLPKLTFLLLLKLQAALVVADRNQSLQITGNGDVLEPHDGIIAIGSGRCAMLAYQARNALLQMSSGVVGMA